MKFVYRYRSSDNVEHCGEVFAPCRDAAFAQLKSRGIRPSRVEDAPGLFNLVMGRGKRWIAIAFLLCLSVGLAIVYAKTKRSLMSAESVPVVSLRHQVYGDPELLSRIYDDGFQMVFEREGDRVLAQYAQPGRFIAAKNVSPNKVSQSFEAVLGQDVTILSSDTREVCELKQIVNGMRAELREYMSDGVGTFQSYVLRLNDRLKQEYAIRERVATELANEVDDSVREAKNAELRLIGLAPVMKNAD